MIPNVYLKNLRKDVTLQSLGFALAITPNSYLHQYTHLVCCIYSHGTGSIQSRVDAKVFLTRIFGPVSR